MERFARLRTKAPSRAPSIAIESSRATVSRSRAQSYPFQLIYKPAVGIQSITYPGSNRVVTATYA